MNYNLCASKNFYQCCLSRVLIMPSYTYIGITGIHKRHSGGRPRQAIAGILTAHTKLRLITKLGESKHGQ
jgi:hypothetical protein